MPEVDKFLEFLTQRSLTLMMMISKSNVKPELHQGIKRIDRKQSFFTATKEHTCEYCKGKQYCKGKHLFV